jgi:hypothetical protein
MNKIIPHFVGDASCNFQHGNIWSAFKGAPLQIVYESQAIGLTAEDDQPIFFWGHLKKGMKQHYLPLSFLYSLLTVLNLPWALLSSPQNIWITFIP